MRRDSRFEYDAEGNRTRRIKLEGAAPDLVTATGRTAEYTWDHRNRLVSVTERLTPSGASTKVVEFSYNAANEQIARAVHLDGNVDLDDINLGQGMSGHRFKPEIPPTI